MRRDPEARSAALLPALAAAAMVIAVVRPPELFPLAGLLVQMLAAAALVLLAAEGPLVPPDAARAGLILLPLAVAAVLSAAGRARAVDEAAWIATFVIILLTGSAAGTSPALRRLVPVLLSVLGTVVAAQAVVQHHWAWPRAAAELRVLGPAADAATDALLMRLEAGRPSGPFVLPNALAGFLALTLPASLFLARRDGRPVSRAAAIAALAAQVYALLLTRSIGGVAAAAAGLVVLVVGTGAARRGRLIATSIVFAAGVLMAATFLVTRRAEITSGPGADPVSLRAGNWRAAVSMVLDHPLLGVGPGGFGTYYPRYMQPGMNETRYAHNSWLQIAAAWGVWAAVPLFAALAVFLHRARRSVRRDPLGCVAVAGGVAFLVHNTIDFTFFLPGVAVPAALLMGMAGAWPTAAQSAAPAAGQEWPAGAAGKASGLRRAARLILAGGVAVGLAVHGAAAARTAMLLEKAGAAATAARTDAAADLARHAAKARPGDPEPWAFLSELILANHRDDPALMIEGRDAAARAVALDPEAAIRHHVRALYHSASGEPAAAIVEERRAHELFPLKPLYGDAAGGGSTP
jgi:O-antigen ligase